MHDGSKHSLLMVLIVNNGYKRPLSLFWAEAQYAACWNLE